MVGSGVSLYNSIVENKFIYDLGTPLNTLLNLIVFLFGLLICLKNRPLKSLILSFVFSIVYLSLTLVVFMLFNLVVDLFLPLGIIAINWAGVTLYKFFEQVRKREIMEKELDIAQQIQESFLPPDTGNIPGVNLTCYMKPAKFVAGDLYDFVRLDEGKIGIFIGDVHVGGYDELYSLERVGELEPLLETP